MKKELQLQELKKLLEIFPRKGRDARATKALASRRESIRSRIEAREAAQRAAVQQSLMAPRCVLASEFRDEEGERVDANHLLATLIGGLDPSSPLVSYLDCGGCGGWVPLYPYPQPNIEEIPAHVAEEIRREWEMELQDWRELVSSLQRVEYVRYYSYFGDDDTIKQGEEIVVKWVAPDGKEFQYQPTEPPAVSDRLETWWWANVFPALRPQIEAVWREQALAFLATFGWEVRL